MMLASAIASEAYRKQQLEQLEQFIKWLLVVVFSMATLQLVTGLMSASRIISLSATPTYSFGFLMLLALSYVHHGRLFSAVITICAGFFAVGLAIFLLVPSLYPVIVLGPILATVVTLPYISSRQLLIVSFIAWIMLTLFTISSRVMLTITAAPQLATDIILISAMVTVTPMLLLLLWQFHHQLTSALEQALQTNALLQRAMDETRSAIDEAQSARTAAEQANNLKTHFLANMSHELRTPLNSIINFTRILSAGMRGPVNVEQIDYLNRVRQSGEHLLGLINDILDLSKIEAGRMDLYRETILLPPLIRGIMSTAAGLTKDKMITLRHEIEPNLPPIQADRTRLRQILLNLLSNAAKFTYSGSITIRVQRKAAALIISVSDTGIGIAPEDIPTMFEEFRQIESATNRRYEGTGLGLAICRKLVELHGGRIWCESTVGVGSTFFFSLPIQEASTSMATATLISSSSTGIPVLVIDDDPAAIEIVAAYLEGDGYSVYGLTESRRALEEARLVRPAAIILDVMMPHLDGWEVLAALKSDPQLRMVPVALYTILEEQERGFYLGASAYLVKPIDAEQLRTTVSRLVSNNATILVIDDDPRVCETLTLLLEKVGCYKVVSAIGGQAGLDQIAQMQPDLIILDLIMPEVDGFAVLHSLDRNPASRALPVIVLTSKDLTDDERAFLQQRVRGLLQKGAQSPKQLLSKVGALFSTAMHANRSALLKKE